MGLLFMCPIIVQPNANVYSNTPKQVSLIFITLQIFSGVSYRIDKRLLQMYPFIIQAGLTFIIMHAHPTDQFTAYLHAALNALYISHTMLSSYYSYFKIHK